jgi:hypothetical protein
MEFVKNPRGEGSEKADRLPKHKGRAAFSGIIGGCGSYIHATLWTRRGEGFMRAGIRRVLVTVASFALVVHTALWGIAPTHAGSRVDPFAVICHSGTTAPSPAPNDSLPTPAQPCDHCNLCSVAAPLIPPDTTLVADFGPTRTLQVLYPANIACKGDVIADSRSARGPPAFA